MTRLIEITYNDYSDGGLHMVDVEAFSQAQRVVLSKHQLDPNSTCCCKETPSTTG